MSQVLDVIRLLGLAQSIRVKQRFDEALPYVRGYAVCSCLWALLDSGALDRLLKPGGASVDELAAPGAADGPSARATPLDRHVLDSILSYLDGLSLVRVEGGRVTALPKLQRLMAEPRGFFELTFAYEPIFAELGPLLAGKCVYPRDVQRQGKYVGRGSGQLCRTLPYPVLADMIRRHGAKKVLDLGCGDLAFLFYLDEAAPGLAAVGIDIDEPTVAYAREVLASMKAADRIEVRRADMFDLAEIARDHPDIDAITAVDTYHEYLTGGEERIIGLMKQLRARFPKALLYVGEFCKQPHEKLRRSPTAFLEHHLYHDLTNQTITTAARWRAMFAAAGLTIVEEKVFDIVGHGYFVLR
jgi:SAM-dependent methyltransferase